MTTLTRIIPYVLNPMQKFSSKLLQQIASPCTNTVDVYPGGLFNIITRNIIRVHFPRPSEKKRITRHGFKKRMSTPAGRRILMNRILKGKFVYSH